VKRRLLAVALALALVGQALGFPITEERKLGERFSIEAAGSLPLIREPVIVDYVTRIGQRIVDRLEGVQPFEYRFSVVRDGTLNAFAVPGGFVYVNTGIVLRAANESELAGVLGHEIGHAHAHHIVRQQEKTQLLSYAAIAAMLLSVIQPAIGAAAMGGNATAQLKYQRGFEQEADYLGIRYMRAAGFDPHGMVSFMKRLWDEQRTMPVDQIPPYMLSHPLTDERITNLEAAVRNVPVDPGAAAPSFGLERVQAVIRALGDDRDAVVSRYEKASTSSARALALYGTVLLYQGDAARALPILEKAKAAGMAEVADDLAAARLRSGDVDGALTALRGRVEADPGDAVAHALLGQALSTKKDYRAAVRELERARELGPELDQVEYDLGQAYGRSGDPAHGFFHLARALEMRGEVEQARAQYEKAEKQLPPNSPEQATAKERAEALGEIAHRRIIGG